MPDDTTKTPVSQPVITIPGLGAVPVVAVRLPDGTVVLRHPSELGKTVPPLKTGGNKS
jgi:hypothetical protein